MTRRVAPLIVLATIFLAWSCDLFENDVVPDDTKTEIENSDVFTTPNSSTVIDLKSLVKSYSNVSLTITDQPKHGALNKLHDALFTYTPKKDFKGKDRFVIDVQSAGKSIRKDSINIFVGQDTTQFPCRLFAMYDSIVVPFTNSSSPRIAVIDVLANDRTCGTRREDIRLEVLSAPSNGHAALSHAGAKISYSPNEGYYGPDSFLYKITNENDTTEYAIGLVNIMNVQSGVCERSVVPDFVTFQIESLSEYTMNVILNDNLCVFNPGSDHFSIEKNGDHGTASVISFGMIKYVPTEDAYLHGDSISYKVCINDECFVAGVKITFVPKTCTTTAHRDTLNLPLSALSGTINPFGNDVFCADLVEFGMITEPKNGTGGFDGLIFHYAPWSETATRDSVTYRACDRNNKCSDAVILILRH